MANEKGFDGDVIEKALAHEQRNKVRVAYHRSEYLEQRRELMQWWGNLLQEMEQEFCNLRLSANSKNFHYKISP